MRKSLFSIVLLSVMLYSCGTLRKADRLRDDSVRAELLIPSESASEDPQAVMSLPDTMEVTDSDGNDVIIMRAVKDESGEMVATDVLAASRVVARFRNVAERQGKVDLHFDIVIPERLQDSRWQIRFRPHMMIFQDTVALDPVIVTGRDYRKAQLKGYQQYERFLRSIITDQDMLVNISQLEQFLKRNLPEIYAFKNDSTYVSDERFSSFFGVTEKDAIEHYTNHIRVWYNGYKESLKDSRYKKYVKVPIQTEGIRLDTVIQQVNGDLIYSYTQSVRTRPHLRKVDITMAGEIYEQEKKVYSVPESGPLTFYISSISTLVDDREKYLTEIIERKVEANTACYIDFRAGRSDIDRKTGHNDSEIARIEENLLSLLLNEKYDLDSIVVTASASPEGPYHANSSLSDRRSQAVSSYFDRFLKHSADSVRKERGVVMSLGASDEIPQHETGQIRFISRNNPENWQMLDALVQADPIIGEKDKETYFSLSQIRDPDEREKKMQQMPSYRYMRENLYPRLRTVRFDFHLHRKGMQKDSVHTTVLDTVYMAGIQAIKERDYETAVTLLRPYHDYNTAVAYCCMEYDNSALEILEGLEKTAPVNYMSAILYARKGNDREAVQSYLRACGQDHSFVHRGNLDPEISALIARYSLTEHIETDLQ